MLIFHRCVPVSRLGSMWCLWWTKRHWGRFSPSTSASPANHSTNFSIIIITRGWHNRPLVAAVLSGPNWTSPPTIQIKKKLYKIQIFNIIFFFKSTNTLYFLDDLHIILCCLVSVAGRHIEIITNMPHLIMSHHFGSDSCTVYCKS
jgi:hypothetical protein